MYAARKRVDGLMAGGNLSAEQAEWIAGAYVKIPKGQAGCICSRPVLLAEKEGFEPSRRVWRLHDFQSCALDRARRLLHAYKLETYIV